ncbi:MAG: PaaI family thioesterase [Rhodospirillaceae bacterium]|nr:PaaI family thioesterase [Rhodospirillaceae bacterium]
MNALQPRTSDFEAMVQGSFDNQAMMAFIGAEITEIQPGFCEIHLPFRDELTQQHGFFHAGATSAIVDSAGGYAAFSLFEEGDGVLTVEFKLNLTAPAKGYKLIARGEVIKPGRTLTVTKGEVIAVDDGKETVCAIMQQTMMRIVGRSDVSG